jgi:hypothetical protein
LLTSLPSLSCREGPKDFETRTPPFLAIEELLTQRDRCLISQGTVLGRKSSGALLEETALSLFLLARLVCTKPLTYKSIFSR